MTVTARPSGRAFLMSVDIRPAKAFSVGRHLIGSPGMAREHPIPWLMGHPGEPLVTQSGLLHLAGPKLTPVTLQNWANREHLAPYLGENPNKKTRRRYDGLQVVNVCLSL